MTEKEEQKLIKAIAHGVAVLLAEASETAKGNALLQISSAVSQIADVLDSCKEKPFGSD